MSHRPSAELGFSETDQQEGDRQTEDLLKELAHVAMKADKRGDRSL